MSVPLPVYETLRLSCNGQCSSLLTCMHCTDQFLREADFTDKACSQWGFWLVVVGTIVHSTSLISLGRSTESEKRSKTVSDVCGWLLNWHESS